MTDKKGFIYTILLMSLLVLCSFFMFVESIISLSLVLDDNKLEKIRDEYVSGDLLTGELKSICIEKAITWMKNHHELKEQNQHLVKEFLK